MVAAQVAASLLRPVAARNKLANAAVNLAQPHEEMRPHVSVGRPRFTSPTMTTSPFAQAHQDRRPQVSIGNRQLSLARPGTTSHHGDPGHVTAMVNSIDYIGQDSRNSYLRRRSELGQEDYERSRKGPSFSELGATGRGSGGGMEL